MGGYTEDELVEQSAIKEFQSLGWEYIYCMDEVYGDNGTLGRENPGQVVLRNRLIIFLKKANPQLSDKEIDSVVNELERDRSSLNPLEANKEIYKYLKDGARITITNDEGDEEIIKVKVIDWDSPENNDYLLTSQLWITGDMYRRRADLVGFVNGLPLVLVELKATHERLESAYKNNLRDYKNTIPQLFWYNQYIILSNGSESRIGTISSGFEHFSEWKKINSEGEQGIVSLDTMIKGTCEKSRFCDLIENFIIFTDMTGQTIKVLGKNHQYLGVNNAFKALEEKSDKIGVFWHTQGSGKSFSMVFFSQKALRKLPGNWTFIVVTDRKELDKQIYKNFANAGVVTEGEKFVHASSKENLKKLLKEDHRFVFTTLQKFDEVKEPVSTRDNIIVMTDEAHRSQYDTLALNMRNALPEASFIGFTGTPLMAGEEKTKEVFGDYVSIYNFRESIEDKNTVPLYYENRIPELQLKDEELFEEKLNDILESAELDENQEKKLDKEFGRQYHLITREERLDHIAEDIMKHFTGRGFQGKAMVVSIDKATAVKMYNKVESYIPKYISELKEQIETADELDKPDLQNRLKLLEKLDMAVVVSQSQNEIEDMKEKGLDIRKHRERMLKEDLEKKFKDSDDNLRLVFVCAMWMTGFDVPSCSTIYLDKPMKNHTLMQTIARANRVFPDKVNGLIVDYIGIFRNLQKALAIYGSGNGRGDAPAMSKDELVKILQELIRETEDFCKSCGVSLSGILETSGLELIRELDSAVDSLLVNEDTKKQYLALANKVNLVFKSILPDIKANEFRAKRKLIVELSKKIAALQPQVDIDEIMSEINDLLDESIETEGYKITKTKVVDLGKVDFEKIKVIFKTHKHIAIEELKNAIANRLGKMVEQNKERKELLEKFQHLLDEYNSGSKNVEEIFKQLMDFSQELDEEERRAIKENMTEEQLAIFDILTKPDLKLSEKEIKQVKKVCRELIEVLKNEKLVLDWKKKQQARAGVLVTIEDELYNLPSEFTDAIKREKLSKIFLHIFDSYQGKAQSIYA